MNGIATINFSCEFGRWNAFPAQLKSYAHMNGVSLTWNECAAGLLRRAAYGTMTGSQENLDKVREWVIDQTYTPEQKQAYWMQKLQQQPMQDLSLGHLSRLFHAEQFPQHAQEKAKPKSLESVSDNP